MKTIYTLDTVKNEIKYFWGESDLKIQLGVRIDKTLRWWYFLEMLISISLTVLFLLQSFTLKNNWMYVVSISGCTILFMITFYRYFSRRFLREELVITQDTLSIVNRNVFYKRTAHFFFRHMGPLHYIGKEARTDHPLKGYHYDFLGIDHNDTLLQNIYHTGNLLFYYKGQPIRFGKGIYSWHAEEMIRMIQIFTGSQIRLGEEWKVIFSEMEWQERNEKERH